MDKVIKVKYEDKDNYCTDYALNQWDIDEIYKRLHDFDWFVYRYGIGSYEGDGNAIFKKDGKFYECNLGHCSCYGPTDGIRAEGGEPTLEALLAKCSEALREELAPLVKRIKKRGLA